MSLILTFSYVVQYLRITTLGRLWGTSEHAAGRLGIAVRRLPIV